ncbi:uncharacterized protein LDX57_007710 [Aspergillus melleus]|uniref:uncharacterized protein n=1 Tax=Aspergillus melleus TaxID=138277 RepID=UPI001E8E0F4D|nr:uncharacterized protein LDX57_007709 [Aspergillus melleus]XP_045945397.1 uncharacterized protein LDX57_007710 [Aspergillus melleus]KAH8430038.1 hypothetical protein LDX57_007709 [Aspergillus melleus]KAH8430039.1 hypothetical protein LDX57_007710 [Aspergillus melleus]
MSSSSKHAGSRRPTGVSKRSVKTRRQANQEAESLKHRMNNLEAESQENKRTKADLEKQLEQVQERTQDTNGIDHDQNESKLKDLLNQLNGVEQRGEALSAQIEETRREQDGSEMETDEVDREAPNFAQTRDESLPPNEGDTVVKTENVDNRQASRSGGGTKPRPIQTGNAPIQSAEQKSPARQGSTLQIDDDSDEDVLIGMQSLSVSEGGIADAWFRVRQTTKAIVRFGPKRYPRYEVRPGKGYSTANLQEVSDAETRIACITTKDETGRKRRLYGIDNIAGFDGVAIVGNGVINSTSRAPTTYVKIKWVGIKEQHANLCRNGKNWATRTDLVSIIGKELADEKIRQLWDTQEKRYAEWDNDQMGQRSLDRSPTPFPLDVYQNVRRTSGNVPPEAHRSPAVKREEGPLSMAGPYHQDSTPMVSGGQAFYDSSPTSKGPQNLEPTEASSSAAQDHGRDNAGNSNTDQQKPKTFSQQQYVENMKLDIDLDEELRKTDLGSYMKQMALIRANFDVYRDAMNTHGYVEVH